MQVISAVALALAAAAVLADGREIAMPHPGTHAPAGTLAVRRGSRWIRWWSAKSAPTVWTAPHESIRGALQWQRVSDGVEWSELRLAGNGITRRVRVIVARIDPAKVRLNLEHWWDASGDPAWSVDHAPSDAVLSFNAGQFSRTHPWGWVVRGGRELQPPGSGSLSVGIGVDAGGAIHWINSTQLADRTVRRQIVEGFQSYPRLLDQGRVPTALQTTGTGVDLEHRDARLAMGQTRDGKILIALTRFDGVGGALDFVPFGLTTPEMAAVMGAMGSHEAVMLDGGISSQMLIRDAAGVRRWAGLRDVPMGLVVSARSAEELP